MKVVIFLFAALFFVLVLSQGPPDPLCNQYKHCHFSSVCLPSSHCCRRVSLLTQCFSSYSTLEKRSPILATSPSRVLRQTRFSKTASSFVRTTLQTATIIPDSRLWRGSRMTDAFAALIRLVW
ncbi:hypothetical protein IWZ03DRAFT_189052 [Phyllosticta citriasiana]|uniref:Uncharacterized protein n=1 Tax=Phyllosticta citriasiana TaxID=595635 RepID=A0ABR1KKK4_9PEZI